MGNILATLVQVVFSILSVVKTLMTNVHLRQNVLSPHKRLLNGACFFLQPVMFGLWSSLDLSLHM